MIVLELNLRFGREKPEPPEHRDTDSLVERASEPIGFVPE